MKTFMNVDYCVQLSRLRSNKLCNEPIFAIYESKHSVKHCYAFLTPVVSFSNPIKKMSDSVFSATFCIDEPDCSAKKRLAFSSAILCIAVYNSGVIGRLEMDLLTASAGFCWRSA